jgi:ribosomal protein L11 methylase PrmA
MEILPKLRFGGWLILSGILRSQEDELTHVLQQNQYDIVRVKRRGKWVAILARRTGTYGHQIWSRQILRWS